MAPIDFFTVPTIRFGVPYVFPVLAHDRRRREPGYFRSMRNETFVQRRP